MFYFSMFALALIARFRSPSVGVVRVVWLFISLLPSELPWAFAIIQVVVTTIFLATVDIFSAANLWACALSVVTLCVWFNLHQKTFLAKKIFASVLQQDFDSGINDAAEISNHSAVNRETNSPSTVEQYRWLMPFSFKRPGVEHIKDIAYGSHPRQQLDIYRPSASATASQQPRPVLMHVHGGGWMLGHKHQQALPLMHHLAQHGWLCVDINYRLAPKDPYPNCLIDVKTAIAWLKQNISRYGGDPEFIALTGGSAGAHLCTLAALTPNRTEFQPGFESCDTEVQAVVAMYGIYNLTEKTYSWSRTISKILQQKVMAATSEFDQSLLRAASPRYRINTEAPPIFIIHGTTDCLVFVEDVREFVQTLREASQHAVFYAELPGAQHGFDLFHCVRTEYGIEAVRDFLQGCYRNRIPLAKDGAIK